MRSVPAPPTDIKPPLVVYVEPASLTVAVPVELAKLPMEPKLTRAGLFAAAVVRVEYPYIKRIAVGRKNGQEFQIISVPIASKALFPNGR